MAYESTQHAQAAHAVMSQYASQMNVFKILVLLGRCAASIGSLLPTFRDKLSVPFAMKHPWRLNQ